MKTITFPRGPIFGADGKISPNGILLGYEPETDNLKQWFYDDEHTTLAPNPIQAASDGRIPEVYLGEGKYRIRQYAPASEQAIIPDDMTDFPVGDDWTFICEWYCEGETIVKGTKTLTVDFVSDLAGLSGTDAAWVQVMNYSHVGDCFPRWFYYTNVAHTDDGGSVFVAQDGGYWVLAMDGQVVDARIFGVLETDNDVFSNLEKALAYCHDKGKTLFLPAGTYTLATTGTLHAQCPILFGSNVLFNTEDGASVVFSVENEYEIPQTTTMCYAADTDFHIDFSSCPVSGTCHACWNPTEGLTQHYDLSRFNGQSVVAWSGRYEGLFSIKTLVAKGPVGIFGSAGSSIETLVKDGNGNARSQAQTVSVGVAYASALHTESSIATEGSFAIDTLILDADIVFDSDRTFGKVVEAGGQINAASLITVTEKHTLALSAFSVMNDAALASVAKNNGGILDLRGETVVMYSSTQWPPDPLLKVCNGRLEVPPTNVLFKRDYTYVIEDAEVTLKANPFLAPGATIRLINSAFVVPNLIATEWHTEDYTCSFIAHNSVVLDENGNGLTFFCDKAATFKVSLDHSEIGQGNTLFRNCSLHALNCDFGGRVIVRGTMGDLVIEGCHSHYDGSDVEPDGWYSPGANIYAILDYGQMTYGTVNTIYLPINGEVSIKNNTPCSIRALAPDDEMLYWPQTEGITVGSALAGSDTINCGNPYSAFNCWESNSSRKFDNVVAVVSLQKLSSLTPTIVSQVRLNGMFITIDTTSTLDEDAMATVMFKVCKKWVNPN